MGKDLTDTERAIIQQVILDRWNPLRLNKKIATHFGLTINQVRHLRSKPVFPDRVQAAVGHLPAVVR
ncbi:uncharacterized protein METZ01_LOCUS221873 [marine metagenome]|uniref:Uncharacterized protein n=1 Tax=marine metagenome TaxID=408172 RepID=A0A382G2B0_9ZZZZ